MDPSGIPLTAVLLAGGWLLVPPCRLPEPLQSAGIALQWRVRENVSAGKPLRFSLIVDGYGPGNAASILSARIIGIVGAVGELPSPALPLKS